MSPDVGPAAALAEEVERIGRLHEKAVVRTVARGAVPSSVGRVFRPGTKDALVESLPTLRIRELVELRDASAYRAWFVRALDLVADTALKLNPKRLNDRIHPGYKWGHSSKVLSLFVRDLLLFSRFLPAEEAGRLEPWLYCPVDGIVIDRMRRLGFDPGVRFIREIDEENFWTIQARLGDGAASTGIARVWFDDIWSEARG